MRIFGFKPQRFREWREVLNEEKKRASLVRLMATMAWTALKGLPHLRENRRQWRSKMRMCRRCPIYDRGLHRCRPYTGSPLGCGCSVFFLALFKRHCWAKENLPGEGLGW